MEKVYLVGCFFTLCLDFTDAVLKAIDFCFKLNCLTTTEAAHDKTGLVSESGSGSGSAGAESWRRGLIVLGGF